jgi:hypothetical protein
MKCVSHFELKTFFLFLAVLIAESGLFACSTSPPATPSVTPVATLSTEEELLATPEKTAMPLPETAVATPIPPTSTPSPSQTPSATLSLSFTEEITFEVINQQGGETKSVAVAGDLAYLGMGPRLIILDVHDPAVPILVGQSQLLPGIVQAVVVENDMVYVAAGLSILAFDISDPQSPALLDELALPGPVTHLALHEDVLVAGVSFLPSETHEVGLGKIVTIHAGQPDQLQLLDSVELPWYVNALALANETVYASNPNVATFYAVDINSPANLPEPTPFPIATLTYSLQAQDQTLYVGGGRSDLTAWNINSLSEPQKVWELLGEPDPALGLGVVKGFTLIEDHAYLDAVSYHGLTAPPLAMELPDSIEPNPNNVASSIVAAQEAELFVAGDGLKIYDISDPLNVRQTGVYTQPGVWDVAAMGGMGVFVQGDWQQSGNGNQLYTVSLPDLGTSGHFVDEKQCLECYSLFVEMMTNGDMAFVSAADDGIRLIRLADLADPTLVGSVDVAGKSGLLAGSVAEDGRFYTADSGNCNGRNLLIFDLTAPNSPQLITDVEIAGCIRDVVVHNDILYVATSYADREGGSVQLLAASDAEPQPLATVELPATVYDLQTASDIALVATSNGLSVISTTDPAQPQIIAEIPVPGGVYEIAIKDSLALATTAEEEGNGRLLALDISQPSAPRFIGHAHLPAGKGEIAVVDDYILIGNRTMGLLVLKVVDPGN